MVRGAWCVARGAWRVARGAWRVANGAWHVAPELVDHRTGSRRNRAMLYIDGALTRMESIRLTYVVIIITKPYDNSLTPYYFR